MLVIHNSLKLLEKLSKIEKLIEEAQKKKKTNS